MKRAVILASCIVAIFAIAVLFAAQRGDADIVVERNLTYGKVADLYHRASPINYVTADAPPFLFLHGTEDRLVPIDQSRRLSEQLTKRGVPSRVVAFEGEGHGF